MDENPEFGELMDTSLEELRLKTQAHKEAWGFGGFDRWAMDIRQGDLIFKNEDGLTATCPAQAVGSYNSEDGSWMWAWANASLPEAFKQDVLKVKQYGEEHGIEFLVEPQLEIGEEKGAWELTALATKLGDAQGAYCCPLGGTSLFVTFGEVRLSKAATP
ncbi:DUF6882 domain-containing protein [Planctomyces sp. SH-PL62]|uniref:DUF6882 domain-containing protein n=1 Tax=Planctomyces sp. SH-PL62 TaxID=1636152 RepID=UPI00078B6341|nr:DUF6882 domain-containing protein [Planctomyces sp. SH-PL62]AMV38353.1 hypothetical protein VT85_13025 [Planctomyces sp. SH-PL62]